MDVRCERCQTEYVIDDARVTATGVSVRCTVCQHVFKVRTGAVGGPAAAPQAPGWVAPAVPLLDPAAPSSPPVASSSLPGPSAAQVPPAAVPREWRIRLVNGYMFSFRELTSLQRWIVERRVSRDDQISAAEGSWRRLGDIPELASFFRVVDEAQQAATLRAQLASAGTAPSPSPLLSGTPTGLFGADAMSPGAMPPASHPLVAESFASTPAAGSGAPAQRTNVTLTAFRSASGQNSGIRQGPIPITPPPGALANSERAPRRGGGSLPLLGLGVLLLGAVVWYGYSQLLLPRVDEAVRDAAGAARDVRAMAERLEQERQALVRIIQATDAIAAQRGLDGGAAPAVGEDAGVQEASTIEVSGQEGGPEDTAPEQAGTVAQAEPGGSDSRFDEHLAQGERLRQRKQSKAALAAYARAAELRPDRAEPHAGRGRVLLEQGDLAQAKRALKRALELDPRHGVALMGLAETYRAQGKKESAIRHYQQYLEVLPEGPEAEAARSAIRRLKR